MRSRFNAAASVPLIVRVVPPWRETKPRPLFFQALGGWGDASLGSVADVQLSVAEGAVAKGQVCVTLALASIWMMPPPAPN